jgi:hypothetical protein
MQLNFMHISGVKNLYCALSGFKVQLGSGDKIVLLGMRCEAGQIVAGKI